MAKSSIEVFEIVYLSIVAFLTLLGNCLVILAFIFGPRSIRTYTNYFVVNLAVSDLMVGCLSVPFWIVYRIDSALVTDVYSYFIALDILCGTVSIFSLMAISLERMFAVKFTTQHFNLSRWPVMFVIVITWACGILLTGSKFATDDKDIKGLRYYTTFIFVLVFLVPLIVIIASYCVIIHTAKNMMKAFTQHGDMVKELHVAKTISVIIGLFVFCWAPFFIINMVFVYCYQVCAPLPLWIIYVTKMMHYSNSMMNFVVYAVRSPEFRRTFKRILFRCDYTRVRERIRTFSESVVTRSRAASERLSFISDSNHNHEHNGVDHGEDTKHSKKTSRKKLPSRSLTLNSYTDVSTLENSESPGTGEFVEQNGVDAQHHLEMHGSNRFLDPNSSKEIPDKERRSVTYADNVDYQRFNDDEEPSCVKNGTSDHKPLLDKGDSPQQFVTNF